MPENDFEKKVQDKMEGFNLSPSADLWNKVENRIQKGKKRRFILWWPLALLLLGGGIGLAVWLSKEKNKKNEPIVAINNNSIQPTKVDPTIDAGKANSKEVDVKPKINAGTPRINKNLPETDDKPKIVRKEKNNQPVLNTIIEETGNKSIEKTQIKQTVSAEIPAKDEKPSTVSVQKTVADTNLVTIPPIKEKEEKKKKNKLTQWGLGISAGRSAIVTDPGNFSDRAYANAPGTPIGPPAQLSSYRSGTKGHFSLSAEVFMKQPLSPRLDMIAAFGYQYLSTRLWTGQKYYSNQFHFITLGGELSWRFTGTKTNFRWNNGFYYNRLIGSSMLHYDPTSQGFIKDNKRLTKDHIFFNTSLSLPVGKRVTLDPFASYSLTSVMKNAGSDTARTHYSNFGLRLRFLLEKKK